MDNLDTLLKVAKLSHIEVRTEKLRGATSGGFCHLGGKPVVFLNRDHKRNVRSQILRRALDEARDQGVVLWEPEVDPPPER